MLCVKDKEFIKKVERNQKFLIAGGLLVLVLAVSCIYVGNFLFNKAGYIPVTQRAFDKIAQIEAKTPLEFKLKETVLSNLEFEISQYRLIKIILLSLISLSLAFVGLGFFISFVIKRKFLGVLKNSEEKD